MKDMVLSTPQCDFNQEGGIQFHLPVSKIKSFLLATWCSFPSSPSLVTCQCWYVLYSEGELVPPPSWSSSRWQVGWGSCHIIPYCDTTNPQWSATFPFLLSQGSCGSSALCSEAPFLPLESPQSSPQPCELSSTFVLTIEDDEKGWATCWESLY